MPHRDESVVSPTANIPFVIEQTHLAQTFKLLRMHVDLPKGLRPLARSGANPFLPSEIVAALKTLVSELQRSHEGNLQPQE